MGAPRTVEEFKEQKTLSKEWFHCNVLKVHMTLSECDNFQKMKQTYYRQYDCEEHCWITVVNPIYASCKKCDKWKGYNIVKNPFVEFSSYKTEKFYSKPYCGVK